MNIPTVFLLVPLASVTALCMSWYFFSEMMKEEERNTEDERNRFTR